MDDRGAPGGWDSTRDRPSVVQITVESGPSREFRVRRAHVLIAIALLGAVGAVGAIAAIAVLPGGSGSAPRRALTSRSSPTPPGLTPRPPTILVQVGPPSATPPRAFRVPLGCLASTVAGVEHRETVPCSGGGPYVTAVLRRVGDAWRLRLKPASPSCPQMPLPAQMRRNLKGCRR